MIITVFNPNSLRELAWAPFFVQAAFPWYDIRETNIVRFVAGGCCQILSSDEANRNDRLILDGRP